MPTMSWEFGLAIYGAALSSLLAWRSWRRDRRGLWITAIPALNVDLEPKGRWIRVSLQNRGYEVVHLTSLRLDYRIERADLGWVGWKGLLRHGRWYKSWWYLSESSLPKQTVFDRPFPLTLEAGRNVVIWLPADPILAIAEKAVERDVRVVVQDELDRSFRSPKLPTW